MRPFSWDEAAARRRIGETAPVAFDWARRRLLATAAGLAPAAELLLDAAARRAGHAVLDIACGTGQRRARRAARGASARASTPLAAVVEAARARAAAARADAAFLVGDAMDLPVPTAVDAASAPSAPSSRPTPPGGGRDAARRPAPAASSR